MWQLNYYYTSWLNAESTNRLQMFYPPRSRMAVQPFDQLLPESFAVRSWTENLK